MIFFFYFTSSSSKELSFSFYFCSVSKKMSTFASSCFLALKLIVDKVLSFFLSQPRHFSASAYHLNMDVVCSSTQAFQKELGSYQRSVDAATASGNHLVAEVLDDPTVTQQDLGEMNEMWEEVCVKSVQKQERLDKAQEVCNFIVVLLHIV